MALTVEDLKKLPPKQKALLVCLVYLLFGYFYYFFFIQGDLNRLNDLKAKEQELTQRITEKERLASELTKYIKGVQTLQENFKTALTKLPVRKEIPELLHSVTLAGKSVGISFLNFEPQPTVKKPIRGADTKEAPAAKPTEQKETKTPPPQKGKPAAKPIEEEDHYEEIPVKVTINGGYHETAMFFEKVARLPRIINIEDITMADAKNVKGRGFVLNTSFILKTYMFVQKVPGPVNEKKK